MNEELEREIEEYAERVCSQYVYSPYMDRMSSQYDHEFVADGNEIGDYLK